jgi:hypothetical protein
VAICLAGLEQVTLLVGLNVRSYTEADLVTLSAALTLDVRLIPKAGVGCTMGGNADTIGGHVRCLRISGRILRASDGWM